MKVYVVLMKETGVIVKIFADRNDAVDLVEKHNAECFSYEQLYTMVEYNMEVHESHGCY